MNLLPAQPATASPRKPPRTTAKNNDLPAELRTLQTVLRAGGDGQLAQITLSDAPVADLTTLLQTELESLVNDPNLQFEQALIKVDPNLKYAELIRVVDVYSSLKPKPLTKISFAELTPGDGGGSGGVALSRARARRPLSLFRGSELPRLVILAGIALAGWPMVLILFAGQSKDRPPPPPVAVPAVAQVQPRSSPDDRGSSSRPCATRPMETARKRGLPPLARPGPHHDLPPTWPARRGVICSGRTSWERPERLSRASRSTSRGRPSGFISYEINPALAPSGRIYEAWVYSDENRVFPYVLTTEDAPPGLVVGSRPAPSGPLRRLLPQAPLLPGAATRGLAAPMLVGRLTVQPPPAAAPSADGRGPRLRSAATAFVLASRPAGRLHPVSASSPRPAAHLATSRQASTIRASSSNGTP